MNVCFHVIIKGRLIAVGFFLIPKMINCIANARSKSHLSSAFSAQCNHLGLL